MQSISKESGEYVDGYSVSEREGMWQGTDLDLRSIMSVSIITENAEL